MKIPQPIFAITIVLILLTACSTQVTESAVPATEVPGTVAAPSSESDAGTSPTAVPTTDTMSVQTEEQAVLSAFSRPMTATGDPMILYGHVLDASGQLLSGYAVEIWQVDANGNYDHPNVPGTQNRDPNFQFYGTSMTDENGLFAFRTIIPARYEPRPRHIHFKVRKNGAEVLTSQFYFSGDADASQLGSAGEMLLLDLSNVQDGNGNSVKLAFKDIVVNTGLGGDMTLTPLQTEGPYYPVVDVEAFDNDLASVE